MPGMMRFSSFFIRFTRFFLDIDLFFLYVKLGNLLETKISVSKITEDALLARVVFLESQISSYYLSTQGKKLYYLPDESKERIHRNRIQLEDEILVNILQYESFKPVIFK
jgi:hypothetical protein